MLDTHGRLSLTAYPIAPQSRGPANAGKGASEMEAQVTGAALAAAARLAEISMSIHGRASAAEKFKENYEAIVGLVEGKPAKKGK